MAEWAHLFTAETPYTGQGYGNGYYIKVSAGLRQLGNERPYFSVTAELYKPKAWDNRACGQLHGEILAHWPDLRFITRMHLADANGIPMHAKANGWYYLAGYYGGAGELYHLGQQDYRANAPVTYTPEQCLQVFADHVRIPLTEAKLLADSWRDNPRPQFEAWADQQGYRWQEEANRAIALLDTLRGGLDG